MPENKEIKEDKKEFSTDTASNGVGKDSVNDEKKKDIDGREA